MACTTKTGASCGTTACGTTGCGTTGCGTTGCGTTGCTTGSTCGFFGKWVCFEVCNQDAFVQKVLSHCPVEKGDCCPNLAMMVRYSKPCDFWQEFVDCGNGHVKLTLSRPNHTETICFKLGEDIEITRMDGKKVKVTCTKESETKLVFTAAKGSTEPYHLTSELCGDVKCVTTELDGVKKVAKYRRCHGCPTQWGAASCCKTACDKGACPTTGSCDKGACPTGKTC